MKFCDFIVACIGVVSLVYFGHLLSSWDQLSTWAKVFWGFAAGVWAFNFTVAWSVWDGK